VVKGDLSSAEETHITAFDVLWAGNYLGCSMVPVSELTLPKGFLSATGRPYLRDPTPYSLIHSVAGSRDGNPFDWQPEYEQQVANS